MTFFCRIYRLLEFQHRKTVIQKAIQYSQNYNMAVLKNDFVHVSYREKLYFILQIYKLYYTVKNMYKYSKIM